MSNPSVEDGAAVPLGYHPYVTTGTSAELRWGQDVSRSGRRSLYVRNSGPGTGAWLTDAMGVIPGARYQIAVWAKLEKAEGRTSLSVRLLDGRGKLVRMVEGRPVSGTHDWTKVTVEFTPPSAAVAVEAILANTLGGGGEVWFDDLEMEDDLESVLSGSLPRLEALLARYPGLKAAIPQVPGPLDTTQERELLSRLEKYRKLVSAAKLDATLPLSDRNLLYAGWEPLRPFLDRLERHRSLVAIYREAQRAIGTPPAFIVGWQSAMRRVFLKDLPVDMTVADSTRVSLFKGESGAVQMVLVALRRGLQSVSVSVGDLISETGRIPASAITVSPVGFVRIESIEPRDPYPTEIQYAGWWPDPLLDNFPFDVGAGESQPVWLSIRVPPDVRPGIYHSRVSIRPSNAEAREVELEVRVWDYLLPKNWRFANVLSFHEAFARSLYGERWRPMMRRRFLDFLLDRRINLTSIYGGEPFTVEEIGDAAARGQNTFIAVTLPGTNSDAPPRFTAETRQRAGAILDRWVPILRGLGKIERSWAFGFDERTLQAVPETREAAEWLRNRYGIKLLTTLYDYSYGIRTGLAGSVEGFCPLLELYEPGQAALGRSRGTEVWWYLTDWSIEQPAIRSRLFGWMTYKARADGFLHWVLNRWVANKNPLAEKILQDEWQPRLDGVHPSSSGMLVYPGPRGPLSSIRLENFRHGIQDYDLLRDAEERLRVLEVSGRDGAVVTALRQAITLSDDFVRDTLDFTNDPRILERQREMLAAALIALPRR